MNASTLAAGVAGWLHRIAVSERPPASIVAYNIGLFETEDGYSAYLAGAERFDPVSGDWACTEAFTPKERYLTLPVLRTNTKWQDVLKQVVDAAHSFLSSSDGASSFLANCQAVTAGFDAGDLIRIR